MTRLKTDDIVDIVPKLDVFDTRLRSQTGQSLKGLAGLAAGTGPNAWLARLSETTVGVIPFSCGQGIITHFSQTLAGIIRHLGGSVFVASASDVTAIADACCRRADILFMADEDRFVALDLHWRHIVDNAEMTGRGFALGLSLMAGGLTGKSVLVIGCGKVGTGAADYLLEQSARLAVYDVDRSAADALIRRTGGRIALEPDLEAALSCGDLILDASPGAGIIRAAHINRKTMVAAPGMPCGVTAAAGEKLGRRLLHDPLRIGVAGMLAAVIRQPTKA